MDRNLRSIRYPINYDSGLIFRFIKTIAHISDLYPLPMFIKEDYFGLLITNNRAEIMYREYGQVYLIYSSLVRSLRPCVEPKVE